MAARRQRHLRPVEAAALLRLGLVEAGIESVEEQADAMIGTLRTHFARATREDDLLVVEVLRVMGQSESRIWALFGEWCREFDRDAGEVFEHVWAPGFDEEG